MRRTLALAAVFLAACASEPQAPSRAALEPIAWPGDVERVRQIGLASYIDQQLHPERIPDTAVAPRLAGLTTLNMSSRRLAEEYYIPALQVPGAGTEREPVQGLEELRVIAGGGRNRRAARQHGDGDSKQKRR